MTDYSRNVMTTAKKWGISKDELKFASLICLTPPSSWPDYLRKIFGGKKPFFFDDATVVGGGITILTSPYRAT
jgi:hypothetical protein